MGIIEFITAFLVFINNSVVPFILAFAFLFFLYNVYRYFILESDSDEGRVKAKNLALWGILGFVIMLSIWGIVNLLVSDLGFDQSSPLFPDYIEDAMFENPTCDPGQTSVCEQYLGITHCTCQ